MNVFPLNRNAQFSILNVKSLSDICLRKKNEVFWKDLILSLKPNRQIMGLDSKGFHSSQTTNIIKVEKFILKVALFNKTNSQARSI